MRASLQLLLCITFLAIAATSTLADDSNPGSSAPLPMREGVVLPIDGSLYGIPTPVNPFNGTTFIYSYSTTDSRQAVRAWDAMKSAPLAIAEFDDTWSLLAMEATTKVLIMHLGRFVHNNTEFQSYLWLLGCRSFLKEGHCVAFTELQKIHLDNTPIFHPVPKTTKVFPKKAFSISMDSEWIAVLGRYNVTLLRINDTVPNKPYWHVTQTISPKDTLIGSPSLWAISLARNSYKLQHPSDSGEAIGNQTLGYCSGYIWPYEEGTNPRVLQWAPLEFPLILDTSTSTWYFGPTLEYDYGPINAGRLIRATMLVADSSTTITCHTFLSPIGEENAVAFWPVNLITRNGRRVVEANYFAVTTCDSTAFHAIPCETIGGVLQIVAPGYEEVKMCILTTNSIESAPEASMFLFLMHNSTNTSKRMQALLPGLWVPDNSTTDNSMMGTQHDSIILGGNSAWVVLRSTPPGHQRVFAHSENFIPVFHVGEVRACPVGFHKPNAGASPCFPCPPNTYQPSEGQSSCLPCPVGMFCPTGASSPREPHSLATETTDFPFPLNDSRASIQDRMFAAVFNPLVTRDSNQRVISKDQFYTLLGTSIGGLLLLALFSFLQSRGRLRGVSRVALKVDLFKEPAFNKKTETIVKQGSNIGLFFTVVGVLAMAMCLWFVIAFYVDFVPLLVADQEVEGVKVEAFKSGNLGLNNENSVRFEMSGAISSERLLIEDMKKNVVYTVSIRVVDIRPFAQPTPKLCMLISPKLVIVHGCLSATGQTCVNDGPVTVYQDPLVNDCIITATIVSPHTLATTHQIDVVFEMSRGFFTTVIASLEASCPKCSHLVANYTLSHALTLMDEKATAPGPTTLTSLTSSYIVRESSSPKSDELVRQSYNAFVTSDLNSMPAIPIKEWFLERPRDYTFSFQIIETPFWVVQKTVRAASVTDLMIVLLITAVTLSSVLKVVVKIVIKIYELIVRLKRRYQASTIQDFDSDTSALLTSDAQ